jgi:DnaJ-class molecular chaperone
MSTQSYAAASCAYCGGSGSIDNTQCRACDGHGNVMVAQPARECAHCQGKGKKSAYRCNFCRGTGWAQALRQNA